MEFFFRTAFGAADPDRLALIRILRAGFPNKPEIGVVIERAGMATDEVNWDTSVAELWSVIFDQAARTGKLRRLVDEAMADPNAAGSLPAFEDLLERIGGPPAAAGGTADYVAAQIIRGRPFVDRADFRQSLTQLWEDNPLEGPVLVVNGGHESGRSWTWNLISHVGRRSRRFVPRLIDLSTWEDLAAIGPLDVARDIGEQLNWAVGDVDPTAQAPTQARILMSRFKGWIQTYAEQLWLVFDGLDQEDLPPAALRLVANIAAAAENGELQDVRVVLIGLEHAVPGVDFDPTLASEVMTDVPLVELQDYLVSVAASAGYLLAAVEAKALLCELLEDPPPDPVPVRLLDSHFRAAVRKLAGADHG